MDTDIRQVLRSKFGVGSLSNILSVFFLSICGLVLYFLIAKKYDAYTLGLFNLVCSLHLVTAQIGSAGIQLSSLFQVAKYSKDKEICDEIITSALIISFTFATITTLMVFLGRYHIAGIFKNPDMSIAIKYSIVGLWCFILNKLLLNIINGFNRMKAYAFFSSFRYLCMIIVLGVCFFIRLPGKILTIILSVSETALLSMMFIYVKRLFSLVHIKRCFPWIAKHLLFGLKGFPGLTLSAINLRVDVLMLGYFCSESIVGIYSFVAIIIEGINQFPAVLNRNVSPLFTKFISQGEQDKVKSIVNKGTKLLLPIMIGVGISGIILFPFVVDTILNKPEFAVGWTIFIVLITGGIIKGTYAPFSGLMVQSGYPGRQTLYILSVLATNIILNLLLIPNYGMWGAATATSLSFILSVLYLKMFSWYTLKINI